VGAAVYSVRKGLLSEHREDTMHEWRDFWRGMGLELFLLMYVILWAIALLLTHMLTQ
jgi:hypothetical protein